MISRKAKNGRRWQWTLTEAIAWLSASPILKKNDGPMHESPFLADVLYVICLTDMTIVSVSTLFNILCCVNCVWQSG